MKDPYVESVRKKLLDRSQFGIKKYGTTLGKEGVSKLQWLVHAQEEAMDLANYLEVLIVQEMSVHSSALFSDPRDTPAQGVGTITRNDES